MNKTMMFAKGLNEHVFILRVILRVLLTPPLFFVSIIINAIYIRHVSGSVTKIIDISCKGFRNFI